MAEIKIEKKNRPVWPWILAAVIVILAVVLLIPGDTGRNAEQAVTEITGNDRGEVPNEISEYVTFVKGREGTDEMGLHHEYTSEGIRKLSSALEALVDETGTDDNRMNENKNRLREIADYIQDDPQSLTHADSIRAAFVIASDVIVSVIDQNFPELKSESERVQSSARDVGPETATLEQQESVQSFFEESASALNEIAKRWNENGENQ
jgi:hypothetical protein